MFKGVFTPIVTLFGEDGNIDFEATKKLIEHLIKEGVNGILFLGSIGEFFNLTIEEKKEFTDFAIKTVNKRVPVFIGTGGTIVEEVIELTNYSYELGADAAVIISPYYFKLDEESLYRYYAEIANNTKMPIILYNFPDRTSTDLNPNLVLRLAKEFSNIIGIKDTVDSISHTRKIIQTVKSQREDFIVFSGFDEYLIPNLIAGGDGMIGGLSNVVPGLFDKIYNAYLEKDFQTIQDIQLKINELMNIYDKSQPFIGAIKTAVSLTGLDIYPLVRKPAKMLSNEEIKEIKNVLVKANISI